MAEAVDTRKAIETLENLCRQALMDDHGLTLESASSRLEEELQYYRSLALKEHSLPDVFRRFCISLANRSSLWSVIFGGTNQADKYEPAYAKILCDYVPQEVVLAFGVREQSLLEKLVEARSLAPEQAKRQLNEPRALFRLYAKGVLAGASYFAGYKDGAEFHGFIRGRLKNPDQAAELPHYFADLGIPGFGAALAADFLKELGVRELGKPDIWVIRCMIAAGWIGDDYSYASVQRVFWNVWQTMGDAYPPVLVDKLMFLVGSGRFEMVSPVYLCGSRFSEFERRVTSLPS